MFRSSRTKAKKQDDFQLEDLGDGIRGRTIPRDELTVSEELVEKLAKDSKSDILADFIYYIYKIKKPKKK